MKISRNSTATRGKIAVFAMAMALLHAAPAFAEAQATATPIRHVILIIGENRTFDNLFATFVPAKGQRVWNLLSEGIITADGAPGPNFDRARQWQASATSAYSIHPQKATAFAQLGPISTSGTRTHAPFAGSREAAAVEPGLPPHDYWRLTVGGSGLPDGTRIDPRFPATLPAGPFAISRYLGDHDYSGDPVHRFFQMWQQADCDAAAATSRNPSGCRNDLFAWVEATVGAGSNGRPQPPRYAEPGNHEGAVALGFYNMHKGEVPYFDALAHTYALNDNYHQAVMGGTGANHIAIGFGTAIYYAGAHGAPAVPPANQIENPNPQPGSNNFYTQDGYGGGSYVECADHKQPGVAAISKYLAALHYRVFRSGDCRPGAYYIVNNYSPGYRGDGRPAPLGADHFTVPPSSQQNLGLLLSRHQISWHYYGEGWGQGRERGEGGMNNFCDICNPFLYSKQIMTNARLRKNLQGIRALYRDIQQATLPAVAIVKPDGFLDGHPATSRPDLLEGFCRKIIGLVQANPALWKHTAILITMDEGGGYYDSGYIQPLDFFGDGTRVPLIVVSPYSRGVGMVHTYSDHVSFDKFVEANWKLASISRWSRDNLPNPVSSPANPYVPLNTPAIGDLMDMFRFPRRPSARNQKHI
ncbi:MAG: phosphoesterase [Gammaproteobacteria bacterium]|nr:phosphoesterase [Gammaproteobacteria bacterium]